METPRLRLREWRETDAEELFKAASDPDIGPACGWKPHRSLEESRAVLRDILMKPGTYAMELAETGQVIGSISMKDAAQSDIAGLHPDEAELGYWVGRPWWDQGYATEAAEALVRDAFRASGLRAVWAGWFEGNERSHRVLQKLGMAYRFSEYHYVPQLRDVYLLHTGRVTHDEWTKRHKQKKK